MGLLNGARRRDGVGDDSAAPVEVDADTSDGPSADAQPATRRPPRRSRTGTKRPVRSARREHDRVEWHQGTALATRAVHLALLAGLTCGPIALALTAAGSSSEGSSPPTSVSSGSLGATAFETSRASAAGERVVLTWLTATQADEPALQAQMLAALPPTFTLPDKKPVPPDQVWVDSAQEVAPGRWQVVVGARGGAAGAQSFFAVPVLVDAGGAAALTLPARTNPPTSPDARLAPDQGLTTVATEDPVFQTVGGYLAAFLGMGGELDRWVAPGVIVAPVEPRPCRTVKLDDVRTAAEEVPTPDRNGMQLAVIATATCSAPSGGRTVSQYPLVLQVRDQRWEVAADNPGLTASPNPTAAPSTTPETSAGTTASPSDQPS